MSITGMPMKSLVRLGKEPGDCWEWLGVKTNAGYGKKTLAGQTLLAHRWLWVQLFGPIPDGLVINHLCSNPSCVNPHHLECVTQADNVRYGAGTTLTPGDVREIRQAKKDKGLNTARLLAEKFGCSPQLIRDIWKNRAWSYKAQPFHGPDHPRNQYSKEAA